MFGNTLDSRLPLYFPKNADGEDFFIGSGNSAGQAETMAPWCNWAQWLTSTSRIKKLVDSGDAAKNGLMSYMPGKSYEFERTYSRVMRVVRDDGHNTMRISVDHAKVEPVPGFYDEWEIARYIVMIDFARSINLRIVLTFDHWTRNHAYELLGGWLNDEYPSIFARFVEKMMQAIGPRVKYFCVLNEPNVWGPFVYNPVYGDQWLEHERTLENHACVRDHYIEAHKLCYHIILRYNPHARIGIAVGAVWRSADEKATKDLHDVTDFEILDKIQDELHWIGVNPYMHAHFYADGTVIAGWDCKDPCSHAVLPNTVHVRTGERWSICPRAIYEVVILMHERYRKPIMITEHGQYFADVEDPLRPNHDPDRCWYIWQGLMWLHKAIEDGACVIGYLHWSTVDSFEWTAGLNSKFGLYAYDASTGEFKPKTSARMFARICNDNGLTQETAQEYAEEIRLPLLQAA